VDDHRDAKGGRDRIHGDVVVRRSDAARREDIVVERPQRVDGDHDRLLLIRDDADLGEADALLVQPARDLGDVLVLGAPREDLVADNDQRGSPDLPSIGHVVPPVTSRPRMPI